MAASTPHTVSTDSGSGIPSSEQQFRNSSPGFFARSQKGSDSMDSPAEAALRSALEQRRTGLENEIVGLFGAWMKERRVPSMTAGILGAKFGIAFAKNMDAERMIAEIKTSSKNMGSSL